eukprot:m.961015 g.961015  ORF g.961015 m.961015 type:complete len:731 (-) comp23887_c0_seq10:1611-3803(-)
MSTLSTRLLQKDSSYDSSDGTYADESVLQGGNVLESLVAVARQTYSRLDGGHTYFRLARIPVLRGFTKYLMRHGPAAAFILLTIYTPLLSIVLQTAITSDLSICKDSAACPRGIPDTTFTECSVFTQNNSRGVICAYNWEASNRSSCVGQCRNWAYGNDSGICGVTNVHDNNISDVDDDGTIISSTLSCIYPCNSKVCLVRQAPPYPTEAIVALGILGLILTYLIVRMLRPDTYVAFSPSSVLRKLTLGLPPGTFMMSYSSGRRSGEQSSRALGRWLARILPHCWSPAKDLLPGAPRTKLSKESADACVVGVVFVSQAYLRSPICCMELDILRKKPGRVVAFVHSDVLATEQGVELFHALEVEGHLVRQIQPRQHTDRRTLLGALRKPVARMVNSVARGMQHMMWLPKGDVMADTAYAFPLGDDALGTLDECLFILLCAHGVLRRVLHVKSPPMNERWACTSSVLCGRAGHAAWCRKALVAAAWVLTIVGLYATWAFHHAMYGVAAGIVALMATYVVGVALMLSAVHHDPHPALWRRRTPHAVHLLIVLHRTGVLLPASVLRRLPDPAHALPVHPRGGEYDEGVRFAVDTPTRPMRPALVPPPVPIDIGAIDPATVDMLVRHQVIRITEPNAAAAEIQFVRLEPDTEVYAADPERQVFWSSAGFHELHPTTRRTLANCIVEVECASPTIESIICQITLRKFQLGSDGIFPGPHKWSSKGLRSRTRRQRAM